jgi:hypothetical protein
MRGSAETLVIADWGDLHRKAQLQALAAPQEIERSPNVFEIGIASAPYFEL